MITITSTTNNIGTDALNGMSVQKIWQLLSSVSDPEIPVLSVVDLGIIRKVTLTISPSGEIEDGLITITPTYSGCPAMDVINFEIKLRLRENGYSNIKTTTVLSPAWTTDWMTEQGKQKLKAYGIAPPNSTQIVCHTRLFAEAEAIQCPLCNCYETQLISKFGSTPCKSLYQCMQCKEPFDYFKCH